MRLKMQVFAKILILNVLLPGIWITTFGELTQETFDAELLKACLENDSIGIVTLVSENRFKVKPFVDRLISESIRLDLDMKSEEAWEKIVLARKVTNAFKNEFGERSLEIVLDFVTTSSLEQKRKKWIADSLNTLGNQLRGKREERDRALAAYQQALELYRVIGDLRGEGIVQGGIGFVYWYQRDPDNALIAFEEALQLRELVDDRQLLGNSYSDIGSLNFVFFRDYAKAITFYEKSIEIRKAIGDHVNIGKTLPRIAMAYERLGELDLAARNYREAAEVNRAVGDADRTANELYNAAVPLKNSGRFLEAVECLSEALSIWEELGNQEKIGDSHNVLGNVYRRIGEFDAALEHYQKMQSIMEEIGDLEGLANGLSNLGLLFEHTGRYERAAETIEKALAIHRDFGDPVRVLNDLTQLGYVYRDLGDYEKSNSHTREALGVNIKVKDQRLQAVNLGNLANTENYQGKFEEAQNHYREALEITKTLNSPEITWPIFLGLGDNYERQGQYEEAMSYYQEALSMIETLRGTLMSEQFKSSFFAERHFVYESIVHLLNKLYHSRGEGRYAEQAFRLAERGKARSFLDLLAESLSRVRGGIDKELLEKQDAYLEALTKLRQELELASLDGVDTERIAGLKEDLQSKEGEYLLFRQDIKDKYPRYYDLQFPAPVNLASVQQNLLDRNAVLLEYFLGDSSSALWAVTNKKAELYRLPGRKDLQEQVEVLRYQFKNPYTGRIEDLVQASHRLFMTILEPAKEFLRRGKTLIIIPDGILHYLPFEALVSELPEDGESLAYHSLQYLVNSHPIVYGHSASVMSKLSLNRGLREFPEGKTFVAFGDPVFGKETKTLDGILSTRGGSRAGLSRLPHSGDEVRRIAELFGEEAAGVYIREDATEANVKEEGNLEDVRYVHFATHGIINEKQPDFSGLVMTQNENPDQDGFLEAAEIFNLKLNADLVTLSACESGLGRMIRGEGLVGLTRAFMYAGTPTVLVSLWSVYDRSTSELMVAFYDKLVNDKHNKAEALRAAQLSMIDGEVFSHPFYWAPFVLVGDWE